VRENEGHSATVLKHALVSIPHRPMSTGESIGAAPTNEAGFVTVSLTVDQEKNAEYDDQA
jgi:hypothetical protein